MSEGEYLPNFAIFKISKTLFWSFAQISGLTNTIPVHEHWTHQSQHQEHEVTG